MVNQNELLQTILEPISADMLTQNLDTLWQLTHRSDFRKYIQAGDHLLDYLHGFGLDAEKIDLPMDGETHFGDAVLPLSWRCDEATLETTEPEVRILSRYSDTPNLVGMWSPPTPAEGIEADLVYLPNADTQSLDMQDVSGKFILTDIRPNAIREAAAKKNALGIISFWTPYPGAKSATQWIASNTDTPGGWGTKKEEDPMILLALSPEKGENLAQESREHPVRVRVTIHSELYEGKLPLIHTHIRGTHVIPETDDNIEVLALAPLYGQGANSHAVSAAVLMESIRVLNSLIEEGRLERPVRGIRYLWSPKIYGPVVFAHERKAILDRTLYALCVDAGAGNPDLAWSRWSLRFGSVHKRHFADAAAWDICRDYLSRIRPQRALETPAFSLGADVWFNDPALNVATHWLAGGTSIECKHTSLDTPETVDKRSLVDLTAAVSAVLYRIADTGTNDIPQLAQSNYLLSHNRIFQDVSNVLDKTAPLDKATDLKDLFTASIKTVSQRVEFEKQALTTLELIGPNIKQHPEWDIAHVLMSQLSGLQDTAKELIQSRIEARAQQLGLDIHLTDIQGEVYGDSRVPLPEGLTLGTITLDDIPHHEWGNPVKTSPRRNLPFILSWWLMDCQRSISEIENIVRMEVGEFRECIPVWFDFLHRHGYIIFEEEEQHIVDETPPEVNTEEAPDEEKVNTEEEVVKAAANSENQKE